MPQVTVIIPSYNSGDFLRRAVSSVLAQTMSDFEIIVVDDGSSSPCPEIAEIDERVRYVSQPNAGVSVARNRGAMMANSELIAFLDHDDEWMPMKLQRQCEAVEGHPDAVLWCTGFLWSNAQGETESGFETPTYHGMLSDQMVLLSSALMRRTDYFRVGGSSPLLLQMQDWDLFLRLLARGGSAHIVAEHLVRYNLHSGNASRDYQRAAAERMTLLELHEREALRTGDAATSRAIRAGRARTRELFAYQAVDAAREASGLRGRLAPLAFAARMRGRVVARAIVKTLRVRLGGAS